MSSLRISLLGNMQLLREDGPITAPVYGKALALLAYLAVESDRAASPYIGGRAALARRAGGPRPP